MNRLWLSTYGLFFTSFFVLLSTHRAFRKIVRPLEFEDCERAESERIEERTAKRTARQHRTHMSWLLAASYESPDECRHLVGEIDEAIKQATAFRSTLPFPNEPPKLTYYDEDPEFGWKLLPPPAEDLAVHATRREARVVAAAVGGSGGPLPPLVHSKSSVTSPSEADTAAVVDSSNDTDTVTARLHQNLGLKSTPQGAPHASTAASIEPQVIIVSYLTKIVLYIYIYITHCRAPCAGALHCADGAFSSRRAC
jgi:hypothetical protein